MSRKQFKILHLSRSREGAWIEIALGVMIGSQSVRRSREGAWIEILQVILLRRFIFCRSREGAWIEIRPMQLVGFWHMVAPARERGLKFY